MEHTSTLERVLRGVALTLVLIFFMFPIFWIFLMSFQTNETILRIPPSLVLRADAVELHGADHRQAGDRGRHARHRLHAEAVEHRVPVGRRRWWWRCCSACPRPMPLPATSSAAREDIAFTLLSFRFAPPLLVLLPLTLYFQQLGLTDTYFGLIWVYQLICLPLILWIVRGYFEDISPDIEYAYRIAGHSWFATFRKIALPLAGPGIAAAGLLAFIFCWNNFVFALVLASADKQPVTVGALAFVTASGIQYGQIAAAIVLSITPTLAARPLCAALSRRRPVARRGEGMSPWPSLELKNVVKRYKSQTVLDDLSLDVADGETSCSSARPAPARPCCCG